MANKAQNKQVHKQGVSIQRITLDELPIRSSPRWIDVITAAVALTDGQALKVTIAPEDVDSLRQAITYYCPRKGAKVRVRYSDDGFMYIWKRQ